MNTRLALLLSMAVVSAAPAAVVEGAVTDSVTGRPISGAKVYLQPTGFPAGAPIIPYLYRVEGYRVDLPGGETDAEGFYVAPNARPGIYEIFARAPGYVSIVLHRDPPSPHIPFRVEVSGHYRIDIQLIPAASIDVTLPKDASLVATAVGDKWRSPSRLFVKELVPGPYHFVALPHYSPFDPPAGAVPRGHLAAVLPSVMLRPGEHLEWKPEFPEALLHKVTVRVRPAIPTGALVSGTLAFELAPGIEPVERVWCQSDGESIRLPWLPAGSYKLTISSSRMGGFTRFSIGEEAPADLAIDLHELPSIRIHLEHDGKAFPAGHLERIRLREALPPAPPPSMDALRAAPIWIDPMRGIIRGVPYSWSPPEELSPVDVLSAAELEVAPDTLPQGYYLMSLRTHSAGVGFRPAGRIVLRDPTTPSDIVAAVGRTATVRIEDAPDVRRLRAAVVHEDPLGGGPRVAYGRRTAVGEWQTEALPPGIHHLYTGLNPCPTGLPDSCHGRAIEIVVPDDGEIVIPAAVFRVGER
ncbi:MAG: carboxypeptidase-like regulatory domain-containing protein [Bryobacteraceae bacterium]